MADGDLLRAFYRKADYHAAIDTWSRKHSAELIFCFVQFQKKKIDDMPDVFIARAPEVAYHLRQSGKGLGDTVLWVNKEWKSGRRSGCIDAIPEKWRFSKVRVEEVLKK